MQTSLDGNNQLLTESRANNRLSHAMKTARPETLGIEAQTVDTQGTGFNSSETSKDAEMPVRNGEGQEFMCRHTPARISIICAINV